MEEQSPISRRSLLKLATGAGAAGATGLVISGMRPEPARADDGQFANLTVTVKETVGSGTAQKLNQDSNGQRLDILKGFATDPDPGLGELGPTLKVTRTSSITSIPSGGDGTGIDFTGAIYGIHVGLASTTYQPTGIVGVGITQATSNPQGNSDALGGHFHGIASGSADGSTGIGIHATGRKDASNLKATGAEIRVDNQSGSDDSYSPTGEVPSRNLWISPGNQDTNKQVAAAIVVRGGDYTQFDVGLAFRLNGTKGVNSASIRDDTSAATSYLVNGTHATAAIAIADGYDGVSSVKNAVLLGTTSRSGQQANASLVVQSSHGSTADPLVWLGSLQTSPTLAHWVSMGNGDGKAAWFVAALANDFLPGTGAGDTGVQILSNGKAWHVGASTRVISVRAETANQQNPKLGFFGSTPIVKPTVSGLRGGNVALANLLTALASLGLITDSTS